MLPGSPAPGVVLEARPLKLPPPTAMDLCLCMFGVCLNGFACAARLGVNPPSFLASVDPPERAELESALSRGVSDTLAAFKGIPPPLAESCEACCWPCAKLVTFNGEKWAELKDSPTGFLFGEGTKAVGMKDWALSDMNGFSEFGAEASDTLISSSLFCLSTD